MSGTDRSRDPEGVADGPIFVLVAPQMGENIGAAARAMWNFGLDRMRIVAPRDGWPNPKAVAMASGAGRLLDNALLTATTAEAVADCEMVYATTARPREMTKRVVTPAEAMSEARGLIAQGARVGVLFGPERSGLANPDVVLSNAIVTVPVNPAFASLNLAQCALLMAYEWFGQATAPVETQIEHANSAEVGHLLDHLTGALDHAGFFFPEDKRNSMIANLHNLFRRAPLTGQDVRTLRGVVRALEQGPRRRGS